MNSLLRARQRNCGWLAEACKAYGTDEPSLKTAAEEVSTNGRVLSRAEVLRTKAFGRLKKPGFPVCVCPSPWARSQLTPRSLSYSVVLLMFSPWGGGEVHNEYVNGKRPGLNSSNLS